MIMKDVADILKEIIERFNRLNEAGTNAGIFQCWSTAHSMADDAKRALDILEPTKP